MLVSGPTLHEAVLRVWPNNIDPSHVVVLAVTTLVAVASPRLFLVATTAGVMLVAALLMLC